MKKIIYSILGLYSITSIVSADIYIDQELPTLDDCYAKAVPMESKLRGYLGIFFGGDYNQFKSYFSENQIHLNLNNKIFGFRPGIYTGLGWNWHHLYLGLELSTNYHWLNKKTDFSNHYIKISEYGSAVSDLIVGYLTKSRSWLYYLKFGLGTDWDRVSMKIYDINNQQKYSKSKNYFNFKWEGGLGFEWICNNHFSIRYELLYAHNNGGKNWNDIYDSTTAFHYKLESMQAIMLNLGMSIGF